MCTASAILLQLPAYEILFAIDYFFPESDLLYDCVRVVRGYPTAVESWGWIRAGLGAQSFYSSFLHGRPARRVYIP